MFWFTTFLETAGILKTANFCSATESPHWIGKKQMIKKDITARNVRFSLTPEFCLMKFSKVNIIFPVEYSAILSSLVSPEII